MFCDCNNIFKILSFSLIIILLIVLVVFIVNNQNNLDRNILVAIATPGDNVTIGTTSIKFSKNEIVDGIALSHQEGSDEININEDGIYQISYQLYGFQDINGTFNFSAILSVNNQPLNDTLNQSPVIKNSPDNRMTLTSTVILKLKAGDVLKLNGVSIEDIRYDNARIDIEKIG